MKLVPVEVRNGIDNHPGRRATKVYDLVHQERHYTSGEGVILHVEVPSGPQALDDVELHIDLGYLFEDGEVVGRVGAVETTGDGGIE